MESRCVPNSKRQQRVTTRSLKNRNDHGGSCRCDRKMLAIRGGVKTRTLPTLSAKLMQQEVDFIRLVCFLSLKAV